MPAGNTAGALKKETRRGREMRNWFLILLFICACINVHAQIIITKIAGQGKVSGYSGDQGLATDAKLFHPEMICLDKYGDIYFTDSENGRIRKITVSTGIITTIAGNVSFAYSGDGGPATDASLFFPTGICIDTVGNIYTSDVLNRRIREVNISTGIITTIAGNGIQGNSGDNGPATDAQINGVTGLCTDKSDNIYFTDNDNNNVRKININTGIITAIAGTGVAGYSGDNGLAKDAQLHEPTHPFVDNSGNILVTDMLNNVVRKIDMLTGIITTIAGTGAQGHTGDNGLAKNADLYQPLGIFVDANDNIFISEYWTGTVRRVDGATKIITTVAGKGTIGFSGDGGPATNCEMAAAGIWLNKHGEIFIADQGNHVIRKVYDSSQHYTQVNSIAKSEVRVYPNPASDELTIEGAEGSEVSVYSTVGQRVLHMDKVTKTHRMNIAALIPGNYIVQVADPSTGLRMTSRFVVAR